MIISQVSYRTNGPLVVISYQNPGSDAFSRLKMPKNVKNNLIADNFLIQFFAHAILKYSASAKESTLTVYKGNVCKKWRKKIEVRSGERLHLQWHKDTFSQAHNSADSKLTFIMLRFIFFQYRVPLRFFFFSKKSLFHHFSGFKKHYVAFSKKLILALGD